MTSDSIRRPPAIEGCLAACRRCEALIHIVARKPADVATRAFEIIGPHLRHCLDHFVCLLRGLDSGVVDYDARDRDERIEKDPHQFLSALDVVVRQLRELDPATIRRGLTLRQESAPDGGSRSYDSNVERELVFLSGHTIHHLAIMKLLAKREGVELPDDLAMAFSTASYLAGKSVATPDLGHA